MSSSSSKVQNVVIIGGGCAGTTIAAKLDASLPSTYRVVLIEKRGFFYHTIGALRSAVEELDIMYPYDKLFKKNGIFVQAQVMSISEQSVRIDHQHNELGEEIPFSYLVIATGSSWSSPFLNVCNDMNEAKLILGNSRENIANATSVLIVGGGACGIELAAEIKERYPAKKVTLIHAQSAVLNDHFPQKFRKATQQAMEKIGIELVLEDNVDVIPEQAQTVNAMTYRTQKGKEINADFLVYTIGARPNVALVDAFDATLVGQSGVRVRNTFQMEHATINNIFVAGDAAGFSDCKTAYKAMHSHAPIVSHNILALIKGKGKLKTYTVPAIENTLLVTLGKKGGTSLLGGMVFGDFTTRMIKSKGLFISSRQKDLGY